jgi:hypothetical protein
VSCVERAATLLGQPGGAAAGPGWLNVEGNDAVVPATLRRLLQAGIDVFEVCARRSTLEDLFFGATSDAQRGELS